VINSVLFLIGFVGTLHATVWWKHRSRIAPFCSAVAVVWLHCCVNFCCQACCQLGRHCPGSDHYDHRVTTRRKFCVCHPKVCFALRKVTLNIYNWCRTHCQDIFAILSRDFFFL